MFGVNQLANAVTFLVAMMICLSIHEAAHALAAYWQGDSTAKDEGRLTLNPLVHLDPIGSVLFPLLGALAGAPILGWARPVPVRPSAMRHRTWGPLSVALAGPFSNLLGCFFTTLLLVLFQMHFGRLVPAGSFFFPLLEVLGSTVVLHANLAFFNLIPFPPLDGAQIIESILPYNALRWYQEKVAPYGFIILLGVSFTIGFRWISLASSMYVFFVTQLCDRLANIF